MFISRVNNFASLQESQNENSTDTLCNKLVNRLNCCCKTSQARSQDELTIAIGYAGFAPLYHAKFFFRCSIFILIPHMSHLNSRKSHLRGFDLLSYIFILN